MDTNTMPQQSGGTKGLMWVIIIFVLLVGVGFAYYLPERNDRDSAVMEGVGSEESMMNGEGRDTAGAMMQRDDAMMVEDSAMRGGEAMMEREQPEANGAMVEGDAMMGIPSVGSYEDYAPEKLARADSGKVILFFHASWCPTCKALDRDIRANVSNIPGDVTILDIDYDTATTLKQKYGVTYQHTFVQVDAEGNQIKKWSGSPTLAALLSQV